MVVQATFFPRLHLAIPFHTVGGRNHAPVDMVNIPLFTRFYTSQVVQDFFHQQYHHTVFAGFVIQDFFHVKWVEIVHIMALQSQQEPTGPHKWSYKKTYVLKGHFASR